MESEAKRAGLPESDAMQKAVKICPERGKLYVVPEEAALVKDIFHTFLRVNSIRKTTTLMNKAENVHMEKALCTKFNLSYPEKPGLHRKNPFTMDNYRRGT